MKKLLLFLFTLMLSANSYSEWTLFDIDLTTESAVYIEKNTIKKDNNYVYYWELMDFWEPISFTEDMMSVKVQRQVNCNNMKHQNLSMTYYKREMGMGNSRFIKPAMGWSTSSSEIGMGIKYFVCEYASSLP
tara:strand:- start:66 stop:461 length:396 start_codon:yes stop_codon:yes gene_type:complete